MSATDTPRGAVASGFKAMSPILVGMMPFGLVAGIAAVEAGLPSWGATVFSTFVFAGAAQIAALDLLGRGVAAPIVIGTVLVINARFLMYSASLATAMAEETLPRRGVVAYLLTDQAYAVTMVKLTTEPTFRNRFSFYVGGAIPLWISWQAYNVVGSLAGAAIPDGVPIDFAIPLVFAALLVPAVTDRPTLAAAVVSAVVATAAAGLPANLGLLVAAISGIAVGTMVSRRASRSVSRSAKDRP